MQYRGCGCFLQKDSQSCSIQSCVKPQHTKGFIENHVPLLALTSVQMSSIVNPMNATIIQQSPLRLITAKSRGFPDGPKEAFDALKSHLPTLQGRKFYGLVYANGDEMEYYAGMVPDSEEEEEEERKFAELGFPIREVEGGPCARVKMLDWSSKIDQIGPAFGAMKDEYGVDPTRPLIEFYRSLQEAHLLLPVPK